MLFIIIVVFLFFPGVVDSLIGRNIGFVILIVVSRAVTFHNLLAIHNLMAFFNEIDTFMFAIN